MFFPCRFGEVLLPISWLSNFSRIANMVRTSAMSISSMPAGGDGVAWRLAKSLCCNYRLDLFSICSTSM